MKIKLLLFVLLAVVAVESRAQQHALNEAFELTENYYRLLDRLGRHDSDTLIVDSLYRLFYSKRYTDGQSEEYIVLDLDGSQKVVSLDEYLSHLNIYIADGHQVRFRGVVDRDKSFVYGSAGDTVLVYVDKTVYIKNQREFYHEEILTVANGKIVRVGTFLRNPLYETADSLMVLAEYDERSTSEHADALYRQAYVQLRKMINHGWVFTRLYEMFATCIENMGETYGEVNGMVKANIDSLSIIHANLHVEGLRLETIAERWSYATPKNFDTYISLLGYREERMAPEGLVVFLSDENGLQGYVDLNKNMVIAPAFRQAQRFVGGLAAAKDTVTPLYGLINTRGKWKRKPSFDRIYSMPDFSAYVVMKGGKYGAMSYSGKVMVPPIYDKPVVFKNSAFAPCFRGGKWGVVNSNGLEEVECQYDHLEIVEVKGRNVRYRYNHDKYYDTEQRTTLEQIKHIARFNSWSGGPFVASNNLSMNAASVVYTIIPAVYGGVAQAELRGGVLRNSDMPTRWYMPTWPLMFATASITDASGRNLLNERRDEAFATWRAGYTVAWKSQMLPVGAYVTVHYERNSWATEVIAHGIIPTHTTQSLVTGFGLRYRPLNYMNPNGFTPVVELGLSHVRTLDYTYKGGFFDNWGYARDDRRLSNATNNGWRWSGSVGLAWGYGFLFLKYERDMYDVFASDFAARDGSRPFDGWKTSLGIVSLGLTLAF